MRTVGEVEALRRAIGAWRAEGLTIAFVPTMGALHDGHLALVQRAAELADRVVASIFVNPTQFGPDEDFDRYPRQPEEDARLLGKAAGCDLLFLPELATIYPDGDCTRVEVGGPAEGLEGDHRPGHFRGVATVVCKLFHLVQPDLAVFGEKDAQQLAVVRRMVRDLHLPVEIVAHPTVREADGLALSSRNAYLGEEERRAAGALHRALAAAARLIAGGERRADAVRAAMRDRLTAEPGIDLEYAEAVDAASFRPLDTLAGEVVLPVAARVGGTRLIDNLRLDLEPEKRPAAGPADRAPGPVPAGARESNP